MNLKSVFQPQSIAIIGASTKEKSVGNDIVKNLATQGYTGKIYPVNPKAEELFGLKCYPSITAIPGEVEMAIFVVPAEFVPATLEEAAKKGIKGAVVISAGFREVGRMDLEDKMIEICRQYDIALIGPNCLGVINPDINMNASFAVDIASKGHVAFVSQSGALCTAVLDYAKHLGIGFSKFMSIGNKAVVDEHEILRYLAQDTNTKAVAMYVEQLKNAPEMVKIVKEMTTGPNAKPVIILKSGRTSAGASASASHTGALAGDDNLYDSLFKQCGIIRAESIAELFDYAKSFTENNLPKGSRVAIVTNAGGPGVLTTDEAINQGLTLAKLSPQTEQTLQSFLPAAANVHNPVDVLGDAKADRYRESLKVLVNDNDVDAILVLMTPQSMTEIDETAKVVVEMSKQSSKPILASFMGKDVVKSGSEYMKANGVTDMSFPEPIARSMARMYQFAQWKNRQEEGEFVFGDINKEAVKNIFDAAKARGQKAFPEAEALDIFKAYGLPVLQSQIVKTAEEALEVTKKIGRKVVMKIVSKDILHKSDVGGVILNVVADTAVENFEKMMKTVTANCPKAVIDGILVVEMAPQGGVDLIVGSNKDGNLGASLMVGLGGIYVEVFKDVAFGMVPVTRSDVKSMIAQIKASKILDGARGQGVLDKEALINCLGRISCLLTDFPEIKELDLNPVRVLEKGIMILDARVILD